MRQKKLWMLAAVATALMMTACGDSAQKELRAKADQLMEAAHQSKDYGKLLTMADSLEKTGNLSTVKANYWRGYAYDRQKQKDMAERYWRASMEAGENSDDAEDFIMYAKSVSRLANLLSVRGDYKEALKLAVPTVERLEALKCDTTSDYVNLLIYIGCCQAVTGIQVEESNHGFYRAYKKHLENIKKKHNDASYKDAIAGLVNVAHYCVKAKKYQEALYYTRYFGELLGEYEMRPDVDAGYIDRQLGRYDIYKAQAQKGLGMDEEAAETYEAFQETEFSATPEGLALAKDFLGTLGTTESSE